MQTKKKNFFLFSIFYRCFQFATSELLISQFQLEPGQPLPPPNLMLRKILIKNKRLKPDVEKIELELFQQGQLALDNEEPTEDASSAPDPSKLAEVVAPAEATPNALPGQSQDGEGTEIPINYTGSTTNVHPWLSSMINYAQPIKFTAFDVSDSKIFRIKIFSHSS